jgi:hypothetical protein
MHTPTFVQRLRRVPGLTVAFAAAGVLAAAPAAAQVQAGATYGVLFPIFDPLVRELGGVNGAPVLYPVLEKWHTGGPAFTGRTIFQVTNRLDLEIAGTYSPGQVATRDSLNGVRDLRASLMMASIRLPIVLSDRRSQVWIHVAPGLAYTWRSGAAWSGFDGLAAPSGILSAGARGRLNRRSPLWFYLTFEDYLTSSSLSRSGVTYGSQKHHMMIFSLGLVFAFR